MQKILVIEDEESVRSNLLKILQFEKFHVIGAENGYVGLQVAKEQVPDLILCDIMMPELDGYAVRNTLSEDPVTATIPFIFLTAKVDKADMRLGMSLGADDYLTKPFTRNELLNTIFARLDKQAAFNIQFQEKLDRLRGSITYSLPHELLIPLTQIQQVLQTITNTSDSIDQHKIQEMTKGAYASSLRLQRQLQNFLLYALLQNTAVDLEQVKGLRGNCTSMATSAIADVAIEKAKDFEREFDLHLELQDTSIPILEANLAKIVEELIDNAFKFSPPGTPVRIESILDRNMFILYVEDQGRGMTNEQIAKLGAYMQFERKYEQQGIGLGLTIAKRLAELYGGELTIDSIPGKTTVCVTLPM
ncbi:hybrid sensor histidine kinase/response regulator [Gloeocapsopsis dulcis]|uniref:histidine kinase n=1 Tax=Gloeocapsopsis dulcis AAB1 = 1H9 TaxID=1433147 RepID=A0A6N8FXH5_9CHRO|nr:response regulator [Gloeocapsopsis dulcis]MUL36847.1 hybrid sensor histidine kinase/response regulator [Gloeocapsopsis dulcis AAB1 = 1H9]WNN88545.1 response regulator [Gloeocapsopsis dulcis]